MIRYMHIRYYFISFGGYNIITFPFASALQLLHVIVLTCRNILQQDFLGQALFSWFLSVSRCFLILFLVDIFRY
jgi:hypothetical protein